MHAVLIDGKRPGRVLALLGLLVGTFFVRLALCYMNCVTISDMTVRETSLTMFSSFSFGIFQCLAWFGASDWESKERLSRWIVALSICSMCQLRGNTRDLSRVFNGVLLPKELKQLEVSSHGYVQPTG